MNYSVKYYPEKRKGILSNVPVMLSVTFSRQRMFYYTGKRCNINADPKKSQWDTSTNKLKQNQLAPDGQTSQKFNLDLDEITVAVGQLFEVYELRKVTPTPGQLREDLKKKLGKEVKVQDKEDFFSRFEQYVRDAEISDNRKTSLKGIIKKLRAFNPDTTFDNLDLTKFRTYLLTDCKHGSNSVTLFLNGLRSFIRHSVDKEHTNINPFIKFKVEPERYGKPEYISIEQRDILFSANIPDENFALVRDIFIMQCFIGCRYGDLMRLKHSNVVNGCIQYIAAKTKDDRPRVARVPLSEKAKTILSKYNLPDGRLLPIYSLTQFNRDLKKVFRFVELTQIVTVRDKKTHIDKQVTMADIASSHMARRVFIGGLHKKNVKNEVIASMSGHVANSRSFARYYDVDQEDQIQAMNLIQ